MEALGFRSVIFKIFFYDNFYDTLLTTQFALDRIF